MKVAYVTTYDASDVHAWSGSGYCIQRTLNQAGFETTNVGELDDGFTPIARLKQVLYPRLTGKTYLRHREPSLVDRYARQASAKLSRVGHDLVFSPGTMAIAHLSDDKPIVFWTDATFAGLVDFYPTYSNLCRETIRKGNAIEQRALTNCRLAIYSSQWAADTAIDRYDVDPAKVKVVTFGANLQSERTAAEIEDIIVNKDSDVLTLLFVGVDWVRKGGDYAVKVAETMHRRGIKTTLHIVGCDPPGPVPNYVETHGFVSKRDAAGQRTLDRLMAEAHFLLLPTIAECAAVVFAEASSFGLPSLAFRVGGIPSVISDGLNGQTFPLGCDPQDYCDYVQDVMGERGRYADLARTSFDEYAKRLNWSAAGKRVADLLRPLAAADGAAAAHRVV